MTTPCPNCGAHKNLWRGYKRAAGVALAASRRAGPLRIYKCPKGPGWHLTKLIERRVS